MMWLMIDVKSSFGFTNEKSLIMLDIVETVTFL